MSRGIDMYMSSESIKIFSGTSNHALSQAICKHLDVHLSNVVINRFPDGEIGVQIQESIRGDDVFIIQSTNAPANDNLMELLILIDAAKRASAGRITAVIPFCGYARQDRKDKPRVPVTAKLVANLIVTAGANRILALDLHSQQLVGFFDVPVDHLFAASLFIKHLRQSDTTNLTVCSPDFGSSKMAVAYADALGCELAMVAKRRHSGNEVEALNVIGNIDGRDILLVDDMTVTAKTLVEAAKILKQHGARSVMAAVTHCLLTNDGYKLLDLGLIDTFFTTNSTGNIVDHERIVVLNIGEMIGGAIRRIHNNSSITDLFEINGF